MDFGSHLFCVRAATVCALIAALHATSTARSDEGTGHRGSKRKPEWVVLTYTGKSSTGASRLRLSRPSQNTHLTYDTVHWDDKSLQWPLYYGNRLAYWPDHEAKIGYAVEFFHHKVYADTSRTTHVSGSLNGSAYDANEPIENTLDLFNMSNGINYLTLNVMGRLPQLQSERFPSGKIQPYAGVGFGIVVPYPISTIGGGHHEGYEMDGWGWQLFGGMEYRFSPDWGLFVEYRHTDHAFSVAAAGGGTLSTRLRTDHLVIGTTFRAW